LQENNLSQGFYTPQGVLKRVPLASRLPGLGMIIGASGDKFIHLQ
jgi:hypothetical protein